MCKSFCSHKELQSLPIWFSIALTNRKDLGGPKQSLWFLPCVWDILGLLQGSKRPLPRNLRNKSEKGFPAPLGHGPEKGRKRVENEPQTRKICKNSHLQLFFYLFSPGAERPREPLSDFFFGVFLGGGLFDPRRRPRMSQPLFLCPLTPPSEPAKWWIPLEFLSTRIANTEPKLRTNPAKIASKINYEQRGASRTVSEYCWACVSRVDLSTKQQNRTRTTSSTVPGTPRNHTRTKNPL